MGIPSRRSRFIKTLSVIVAATFLWNQLAFAFDAPHEPTSTDYLSSVPGMSKEEADRQKQLKQSIISVKNGIELSKYPQNTPNPSEGSLTFYDDSNGRLKSRRITDNDSTSLTFGKYLTCYYLNETSYITPGTGVGTGRIYRVDVSSSDFCPEGYYYEIEYASPGDPFDDTVAVMRKKDLKTRDIQAVSAYNQDGDNRISSLTIFDYRQNQEVKYQYLNEDWNLSGAGRVNGLVSKGLDGSAPFSMEIQYFQSADPLHPVLVKTLSYNNGAFSGNAVIDEFDGAFKPLVSERANGSKEYFSYTYEDGKVVKVACLDTEFNDLYITEYYDYERAYAKKSWTGKGTYSALTGEIVPDSNTLLLLPTEYSYWLDGPIMVQTAHTAYIDARGNSADYYVVTKFDSLCRVISATERLTASELADAPTVVGKTTTYSYDAKGSVISQISPDGTGYRKRYCYSDDGSFSFMLSLDLGDGELTREVFGLRERRSSYGLGRGHWNDAGSCIAEDYFPGTPQETGACSIESDGKYRFIDIVNYTDAEGNAINFQETTIIDARGNVTFSSDRDGNVTVNTYGDDYRILSSEYRPACGAMITVHEYSYIDNDSVNKTTEIVTTYLDQAKTQIKEQVITVKTSEINASGMVNKYTESVSYPYSETEKPATSVEKYYDSRGRLTKEVNVVSGSPAETTLYDYNGTNDIASIIYPDGRKEIYSYARDAKGRLEAKSLVVTGRDITGARYTTSAETTEYDPVTGETIRYTDKDANVTTYTRSYFDTKCDLQSYTETTDFSGSKPDTTVTKEYDLRGNVIKITEQAGLEPAKITTCTFNTDNTVSSSQDPDGKRVLYSYSYTTTTTSNHHLARHEEQTSNINTPESVRSTYTLYNADGDVTETKDENGVVTRYSYKRSNTGELTKKTVVELGAQGNVAVITEYDNRGNVTYTKDALKDLEKTYVYAYEYTTTAYEYVKSVSEFVQQNIADASPIVITTVKEFDRHGNTTLVKTCLNDSAEWNTTRYSYYAVHETGGKESDLKEVVDARGNKTAYTYAYSTGGYLEEKLTSCYSTVASVDILKYALSEKFDPAGRVIYSVDKYGITKVRNYTLTGEIVTKFNEVVTYPAGCGASGSYSTTSEYSHDGKQLLKESFPDGTVKNYEYNAAGKLLKTSTGENNVEVFYEYAADGTLVRTVETDKRGTADVSDDIIKLTLFFGVKGSEKVKEVRTFAPARSEHTKPIVREIYLYTVSGTLDRVIKKNLKTEYTANVSGDLVPADANGNNDDDKYEDSLDTSYGIFAGEVKKKREVSREGWEDFSYSADGLLTESVYTDGIYFTRTKKTYDLLGEVIRSEKDNGAEKTVTDTSYVKNTSGVITAKSETVKYVSMANVETVLSVTAYTYYGEASQDKITCKAATDRHEIKTMTSQDRTHNYTYEYDESGRRVYTTETVSWTEGTDSYNYVLQKKFNFKGDIEASIDENGVYSEYTYTETPEGRKTQIQKLFYLNGTAYTASLFSGAHTTGLTSAETLREYDFDGDLVKIEVRNGQGTADDIVTGYVYEKDIYGNVLKKYESVNGKKGVKVYSYDLKGDLVSETEPGGVTTTYERVRDANGTVASVTSRDGTYPARAVVTNYENDMAVSSIDQSGVVTEYAYTKDTRGAVTSKTERKLLRENGAVKIDYSEIYSYNNAGDLTRYVDKNGVAESYFYHHDSYGNTDSITVTSVWTEEGVQKTKRSEKTYDKYGAQISVKYLNDPNFTSDDIEKVYTYEYTTSGALWKKTERDTRYFSATEYEYNALGDVIRFTSAGGATEYYVNQKDEKGNLIRQFSYNGEYPSGIETDEFDIYGNKTAHTDANGFKYVYENRYDIKGNLIEVIESHTRSGEDNALLWSWQEKREYDTLSRPTSKTDRNGILLNYSYTTDNWGNTIESGETDSRYQGKIVTKYNALTQDVLSTTDRLGHKTSYTYVRSTQSGQVTCKTEIGPLGEATVYSFSGKGYINGMTDRYGRVTAITPVFDGCGNMIKRGLFWSEKIDGTEQPISETEFYSVDGDLVKRIDSAGTEYRYQYTRDAKGNLKLFSTIETSWDNYKKLDIHPAISVTTNGKGTNLNCLCDNSTSSYSRIDWIGDDSPAAFVIDLGANAPEYGRLDIALRTDAPFKVYTASSYNTTSTWALAESRVSAANTGLQTITFPSKSDRYVIIQGYSDAVKTNKFLEINEVTLYKDEKVPAISVTTSAYDLEGRLIAKTNPTGGTTFYNNVIGDRGEVTKTYEALSADYTTNILVPTTVFGVTLENSTTNPSTSILTDGLFSAYAGITWSDINAPASFKIDLTGKAENAANIGGIGLALRNGESYTYSYRIYYATNEAPTIWNLISEADRSGDTLSRKDDWRVEKFNVPITARYIKIEGAIPPGTTQKKLELEEVTVYKSEPRINATGVKTLDEFGRAITEKNALMMVWEERPDLASIFPDPRGNGVSGYWQGKKLTDWAKMMGAWEDRRVAEYLTDYDSKTYPAIKDAFTKGDLSQFVSIGNISAPSTNATTTNISNICNGILDDYAAIAGLDDGPDRIETQTFYVGQTGSVKALAFDGDKDFLTMPSTDISFGSGNFTVDFWVKFDTTSGYQTIFSRGTNDSSYSGFYWNGSQWQYSVVGGPSLTASDTISANTWYHVALVRSNNTITLYRDGAYKNSTTYSSTYTDHSGPLCLGDLHYGTGRLGWYLKGALGEFRVSNTARWTQSFNSALPSARYTVDTNTKVLLHFDETSSTITDSANTARLISSSGDPASATLDLGAPRHISKLRLRLYDDANYEYKYKIYLSADGVNWGDAIVDATDVYYSGWQEYLFSTVNARYIKIASYGRHNKGGTYTDQLLQVSELMPMSTGYTWTQGETPAPRVYNADRLKEWAKEYGFRTDSELIKLSKAEGVTDEAETCVYSYRTNDKGNQFLTTTTSSKGTIYTFYDNMGRVKDKVRGDATTSTTTAITRANDGTLTAVDYDQYGNVIRSSYRVTAVNSDTVTASKPVVIEKAEAVGAATNPTVTDLAKLTNGNVTDYASATWLADDGPNRIQTPTFYAGQSGTTNVLAFDGDKDFLTTPDSSDFSLGYGDFTVDFWVKLDSTAAYQTIFSQGTNDMNYTQLSWRGSYWDYSVYAGNSVLVSLSASDALNVNTWYHVALVRNGNNWTLYRNGVAKGTTSNSSVVPDYSGVFCLGEFHYGTGRLNWYLKGALSEFRLSNTARWTQSFASAIPSARHTVDANTKVLLHLNETSGSVIDSANTARQMYSSSAQAAFIVTLKDESVVNRIRFCLKDDAGASYAYKVYVKGATGDWTTVADKSAGTSWGWQDIKFTAGAVKYVKIEGATNPYVTPCALDIREVYVYAPATVDNFAFTEEYMPSESSPTGVFTTCSMDILAGVWGENPLLRECFITPTSTGTGAFSGWTLKRWAAEIGSHEDPRLKYYARNAREYTSELDAVIRANATLRSTYIRDYGLTTETIKEKEAVAWAVANCGSYTTLYMYGSDLTTLKDPYIATYTRDITETGNVISLTKTVNLSQETKTFYEDGPQIENTLWNTPPIPAVHLDGSGDYIEFADNDAFNFGANAFTVDFWVKFDSVSGYQTIFSQGFNDNSYSDFTWTGSSWRYYFTGGACVVASDSLQANTWYHVAIVRNGNEFAIYRDGIKKNYTTCTVSVPNYDKYFCIGDLDYGTGRLGWYLKGSLSEFRITKSALWTGNFTKPTGRDSNGSDNTLLMHFNEASGNSWTDSGSSHLTPIRYGDAAQASVTPWYSVQRQTVSAARLDGDGDAIMFDDGPTFNLGTNNFTVDFWVKFDNANLSLPCTLFSQANNDNDYMTLRWTGSAWTFNASYDVFTYAAPLTASDNLISDTWYHFALVRNGNTFYIYRDGILKAQGTDTSAIKDYAGKFVVGAEYYNGAILPHAYTFLKGYMTDFRISNTARTASDFQQPGAYTVDPNTKVLLEFQGAPGSRAFTNSFTGGPSAKSNYMDAKKTETVTLNTTHEGYTYDYYNNGNVRKQTIKKTGYEAVESAYLFDYFGDITGYQESGVTYNYVYSYDRWHNAERITANGETAYFLTKDETLLENQARQRIKEYYRALLYRDPTQSEENAFVALWQKTGYAEQARDVIFSTSEYKNGSYSTYNEKALALRNERSNAVKVLFNAAVTAVGAILNTVTSVASFVRGAFIAAQGVYAAREEKNDEKYIREVYRQVLGREATDSELTAKAAQLRAGTISIDSLKLSLGSDADVATRRAEVLGIINSLYNTTTQTGLLKDYLNASDKYAYVEGLNYNINKDLLVSLSEADINYIVDWLKSQDNHFARSAAEALYSELVASGAANLPTREDLVRDLVFIDIITGVINTKSQGQLLISMHAMKKLAQKYGVDTYGSNLTFEELVSLFDTNKINSAIVHYNGQHFMNVVGIVRVNGVITAVHVIDGYNGTAAVARDIKVDEFKALYEGKVLSKYQSDYDKRLSDQELMLIKGAGWWSKFWKKVEKWFRGVEKAFKKIINYIIEPVKQFINAIKYAVEHGKWGRVVGAVGVMVGACILSFFATLFAYQIMTTAMNMATAICYGQYGMAFQALAIGVISIVVSCVFSAVASGLSAAFTAVKTAVVNFMQAAGTVLNNITSGISGFIISGYEAVLGAVRSAGAWVRGGVNSFMGRAGDALMNVATGMVTSGVTKYIGEEIDKTGSWLGKIGVGLLGAAMLMPMSAFADPTFGVQALNKTHSFDWLQAGNDPFGSYLMTELIFNTASQVVSQETYKALEKSLGEEWYCALLRSSVNSVVSAGMGAVQNAVEGAIASYKQDVNGEFTRDVNGKKIEASRVEHNSDGTNTAFWEDENLSVIFDGNGDATQEIRDGWFSDLGGNSYDLNVYLDHSGYAVDFGFDANWVEQVFAQYAGESFDDLLAIDGVVKFSDLEYLLINNAADQADAKKIIEGFKAWTMDAYNNMSASRNIDDMIPNIVRNSQQVFRESLVKSNPWFRGISLGVDAMNNTSLGQRSINSAWGYGWLDNEQLIAERAVSPSLFSNTRLFLGIGNGLKEAERWEKRFISPYADLPLVNERQILGLQYVDAVPVYTPNGQALDAIQVIANTVFGFKTPATKIISYYDNKPTEYEFFHSGSVCADFLHGNHSNSAHNVYFGGQISLFGVQKGYASEIFVGRNDYVAGFGLNYFAPTWSRSTNVYVIPNQTHDLVDYFRYYAKSRQQ